MLEEIRMPSPVRCDAEACGCRVDAAGAKARGMSRPPRQLNSPLIYHSYNLPLSLLPTASPEPSASTDTVPSLSRWAAVDAACLAASETLEGTPGKTLAGMD